jgi:integrase
MTVSAYTELWFRRHGARLKPRTLRTYQDILRRHLPPALAQKPIHEVTRQEIRRALLDLLEDGYASGTVKLILAVWRTIFESARVEDELCVVNPCEGLGKIVPQRKGPRRQHAIPRDAVPRLVSAIRMRQPHLAPLVLLGLRTGMRLGELLGLQWDDVDLEAGTVTIRRADWRYPDLHPKGGKEATLPLSRDAIVELQAARDRAAHGVPWVFANPHSGRPWHQTHVYRMVRDGLARCGFQGAVHTLRHSFLTHLAEDGVDPWSLRDLARHSSVRTTEGYLHLSPRRLVALVNRLVS